MENKVGELSCPPETAPGPGKPPTGSSEPERSHHHLLNGFLSPPPHNGKRHQTSSSSSNRVRRSASTGRDKKSELQARYWALLFGNLQRAINEIYQTVECYENLSSCQETILVLENYIRDFQALAAWFRVSWDYDATPKPDRRSLAWDVRKCNPVPPKMRSSRNLSSPAISGKSSPSFSGKNSPCPPIAEQQNIDQPIAPRSARVFPFLQQPPAPPHPPQMDWQYIQMRNSIFGQGRPAADSNSNPSGPMTLQRLEEMFRAAAMDGMASTSGQQLTRSASLGELNDPSLENFIAEQRKGKESLCEANSMKNQYSQTQLEEDHLTLAAYRKKYNLAFSARDRVEDTATGEDGPKYVEDVKVVEEQLRNETTDNQDICSISSNPPKDISGQHSNAVPMKRPIAVKQTAATTASGLSNYSTVLSRGTNLAGSTMGRGAPRTSSAGARKPLISATSGTRSQPTSSFPAKKPATAPPIVRTLGTTRGGPLLNRPTMNVSARTGQSKTVQPSPQYPPSASTSKSIRSKTMIEISRKRQSNYSLNTSRLKVSQDDLNSSSSTLKASTERISSNSSLNNHRQSKLASRATGVTSRRSEPKQMPSSLSSAAGCGGGGGDPSNDGWLTVKSKRRSSWSSRFHQPTGYASLPTLAFDQIDENGGGDRKPNSVDNKENLARVSSAKSANSDKKGVSLGGAAAKQKEPTIVPKMNKSKTVIDLKATRTPIKSNNKSSNSAAITPAATSKATTPSLKSSTSTSMTTTGRGSAAPNVSAMVKSSMNNHSSSNTNMMRQKSDLTGLKIKSLHREYMRIEKMNGIKKDNGRNKFAANDYEEELNNATKVDMKIQTQTHSKNYVNLSSGEEDLIMEESDDDQRKLLEEQENLERQIRELENTEIDVDTETDETDYEVLVDNEDVFTGEEDDRGGEINFGTNENDETDENMSLERKYHLLLSEMSMGERMETLATLEAFVARHPGRAQELHQKLSSPSRRRSLHETLKKYQAKQARAAEKRESLLKEKAHKIQLLLARVEDVKQAKQTLIEDKRLRMEERLKRATVNRTQYLKDKVKKAHDEDEKLREIAFIKSLTEQNRRLDLLESSKEHETRMQDLEQERQKRVEEKAAKEAAAERRREELEQERRLRLEKISETRREREIRVGRIQEQKEMERQKLATQKARDREERLQALQAAQQATTEELQRKINQKILESTRRHEELIEHIRQRAQELGGPNRNNEDAGSAHESDLSSIVSDVLEPNKGSKKKLKKLKQKLQEKTEEYLAEMTVLQSHHRRDSEVPKLMNLLNKGGGPHGHERPLAQLLRIVSKAQPADFHCMLSMDTLGVIAKMVQEGTEPNTEISRKAVIMAVQLYRNICSVCPQLMRHAILGNTICTLLDVLYTALQVPDETTERQPVELSTELILCCTVAVSTKNSLKNRLGQSLERLPDVLSYAVLTGLIGTLAKRCAKVREPVEQHQGVVLSLLATLGLLTNFAQICPKGPLDPTRYLSAAKQTELFGVITLLHSTILPIGECIPPRTISLAAATFNLLVTIADLDLATFQAILNEEVLALKYLDVMTILLKYCGPKAADKGETQAVIIDLIGTLGFFCVNNKRNQDLLVSPEKLVILKSVMKLPSQFQVAIYPTLVTVVWNNDAARQCIATEFDVESLDEYQGSQLAKRNKLICLLK